MPSSQHLTSPASLERLAMEAAVTGVEVMADALASAAGTGAAQAAAASQALASVEEMTWRLLQQAAAAFGSFAVASRDISATIERAVEVVTHELQTPMGAVVQLLGPGKVAVVHSRGLVGLACGEEFEVDPELPTVHVPCEPSVMEDWRTEPGFPRTHATTDAGIRARMSVSIPVQGRPWGRLIVSDTQPRQFAGAEVEFVQAVAVALAAALEKEQVEAGRAAVAAFGRFARASPDVASTIERAVDVVTRVLEVPLGAVVRQLGLPGRLALVQAWGPVGLDLGEAYDVDPALARAFRTTQPLVIEDWRTDDRFATPILAASARSIASLSVAVLVAHRVWGRLIVADTRARQFSDADTDVVSAVANALARALEPAQARAPWKRRAVRPSGKAPARRNPAPRCAPLRTPPARASTRPSAMSAAAPAVGAGHHRPRRRAAGRGSRDEVQAIAAFDHVQKTTVARASSPIAVRDLAWPAIVFEKHRQEVVVFNNSTEPFSVRFRALTPEQWIKPDPAVARPRRRP